MAEEAERRKRQEEEEAKKKEEEARAKGKLCLQNSPEYVQCVRLYVYKLNTLLNVEKLLFRLCLSMFVIYALVSESLMF